MEHLERSPLAVVGLRERLAMQAVQALDNGFTGLFDILEAESWKARLLTEHDAAAFAGACAAALGSCALGLDIIRSAPGGTWGDARLSCSATLEHSLEALRQALSRGSAVVEQDSLATWLTGQRQAAERAYLEYRFGLREALNSLYRASARKASVARVKPLASLLLFVALLCLLVLAGYVAHNRLTASFWLARDLFATDGDSPSLKLGGLGPVEEFKGTRYRWALGPKTVVAFVHSGEDRFEVTLKMANNIHGQTVTVIANGVMVDSFSPPASQEFLAGVFERKVSFTTRSGLNTVFIEYELWNGNGAVVSENDARPFALAYVAISLGRR